MFQQLKNNNGGASTTQTNTMQTYGSLLHRYGPDVSEASAVLDPVNVISELLILIIELVLELFFELGT